MGYDVHIAKKAAWSDEGGQKITLEEWIAVVDADSEMRLDGYAEASTADGQTLRLERPGLAVWTGYSAHGRDMAWFDFSQGEIIVKNPDIEILRKTWSLAQRLGAKVQGDDELYDADGSVVPQPETIATGRATKKPWWRFWRNRIGFI
jgi:hypothetical protein